MEAEVIEHSTAALTNHSGRSSLAVTTSSAHKAAVKHKAGGLMPLV